MLWPKIAHFDVKQQSLTHWMKRHKLALTFWRSVNLMPIFGLVDAVSAVAV